MHEAEIKYIFLFKAEALLFLFAILYCGVNLMHPCWNY